MTLAKRAAADLELVEIDELLVGPTGITYADADAVSAAKVLKEFASSHEVFAVKGGLLGTDFLTAERIAELAEIAPRDELLAILAGTLKAPLTAMAGLLAALPRGAATIFQQLLEKKESGEFVGDAPAAEAEAAADEAEGESGDEGEEEAVSEEAAAAAPEDSADASDDDSADGPVDEESDGDDEAETAQEEE